MMSPSGGFASTPIFSFTLSYCSGVAGNSLVTVIAIATPLRIGGSSDPKLPLADRSDLRRRRHPRPVGLLRRGDQLAHLVAAAALAQQLHRVGLAVDDRLEELLAVLVGGERRLRPLALLA